QTDDDISDRLHYYYTTTFLLLTAVLVSLKMFGGRPIECWLPAEYKSNWEDYTEMYCWARSTYFVPIENELPEVEDRVKSMVSYYQWVPFFFVLVAAMFYAPCLFWRLVYRTSGVRLKCIMSFVNDKSNLQPAIRRSNIQGLAAHLSSIFRHRFTCTSTTQSICQKFLNFRFYEAFLTYLYIFVKCLFLINVVFQMFLLNKFLQTDAYGIYGYGVIADLLSGHAWTESTNFPVVTYCDLQIRVLGNVQRHTIQCVLVINIFTEKIFILLWIWYTVLAVTTICSIFTWILASLPLEQRKKFIVRRLELADVNFKRHLYEAELDEFVRKYIKMDGIFVLRMMSIHSGALVCTEVVDIMWEQYMAEIGQRETKYNGQMLYPEHYVDPHTTKLDELRLSVSPSPTKRIEEENLTVKQALLRKTSVLVPLVSREEVNEETN
ncbi:hypothetical protein PMAYCL1PPCAC_00014, partial [Pristionchus mayeri]